MCNGANNEIKVDGPELEYIENKLSSRDSHRPEIILIQLEIPHEANLTAAQSAKRHGCMVALKPSPLIPGKTLDTAIAMLEFTDILFLSGTEALVLLKSLAPEMSVKLTNPRSCVTVGDAELVAKTLLDQISGLHTVVISAQAGHVLMQRTTVRPRAQLANEIINAQVQRSSKLGSPATKRGSTAAVASWTDRRPLGVTGEQTGVLTFMVPRREVKTVDAIGAAGAFTGGFIAAHCRRLSVGQSLLWAHAAGCLSLSAQGAQTSMPSTSLVLECGGGVKTARLGLRLGRPAS